MKYTNTFRQIRQATTDNYRYITQQGGTSSGKTYATLQLLFLYCLTHQDELLVSVVAETIPHLRRGAMRDFLNIVKDCDHYKKEYHNKSESTYKVGNNTIEFFSADDHAKLRGARRDILYINECNNVSYEAFQQLEVRTKKRVYLDFNPTHSFWAHDKVLTLDNAILIKTTYKDNEFLDDSIVKSIERRAITDPNWWRVYGLGEVGMIEGQVFQNFEVVDEMPDSFKWKAYGMDFGFTNDPSTVIDVRLAHGEIWLDEKVFKTGLTNSDLMQEMDAVDVDRRTEIIADSAEPKSIEEIRRGGFRIRGATKGKDSILNGINLLQAYKINITKTSLNLIKEFRNYQWVQDKHTGEYINKPIDDYNHGIDAVRYVALIKIGNKSRLLAFSG